MALLLASFTVNIVIAIVVVIVSLRPKPLAKRVAVRLPKTMDAYTLIDPINGSIKYVGITHNVRRRIDQHIRLAFTYGGLITWIHELYMQGLQPRAKIIASGIPSKDARATESQFIEEYIRAGEKLLNRQLANPSFEMTRRILIEGPEPQR
jgi:hypothetical protein